MPGGVTPGWFRRGAATTAVFTLLGPAVAGLILAGLFLAGRALASGPSPTANDILFSGGVGFLLQMGPGLITGLAMSFASPRIRSTGAWLGWAALTVTMISLGGVALMLRASFADVGIGPFLISMVFLALPGFLGALASAGATLRLRPRPSPKPAAEVFS